LIGLHVHLFAYLSDVLSQHENTETNKVYKSRSQYTISKASEQSTTNSRTAAADVSYYANYAIIKHWWCNLGLWKISRLGYRCFIHL